MRSVGIIESKSLLRAIILLGVERFRTGVYIKEFRIHVDINNGTEQFSSTAPDEFLQIRFFNMVGHGLVYPLTHFEVVGLRL